MANKRNVPWAKLHIGEEELAEVVDTVKSGWLSQGPKVKALESRLAQYVGVKHAIAVNNGTSALDIALKVLGVTPDDEVIVPGSTYIATSNSVLYQHAKPIFADIELDTYNIDPVDVEHKITDKTKGIIAIDYGGHAANYDKLSALAHKYKLFLIEDGAPGLGGIYKGKKLCSFGDIATTSFHIAKIFSTVEGGMIFTNNDTYAQQSRIIRSQGENPEEKYHFPLLGHNYRMSDLHAAVGLAQMSSSRMADVLEWRKKCAEYYTDALQGVEGLSLPKTLPEVEHAWFLYPILLDSNRDRVRASMKDSGVETNVSWPIPVYRQPAYKKFNAQSCPVAEDFSSRVLCLPMFFGLTTQEQDYVVDCLRSAIEAFI